MCFREDLLITKDTTWPEKIIINEGVALTVKGCTLTTEREEATKGCRITNFGSLIMESVHLVQKRKI